MQRQLDQQKVGWILVLSNTFHSFNLRWVISAAHCFCALNEHVQCTLVNRGFKKKLLKDDMIYGKNINERYFKHEIPPKCYLFC